MSIEKEVDDVTKEIADELSRLGTMNQDTTEQPVVEQQEETTEVEMDEEERSAREHGWKDMDSYIAEGKDPAKWRGYKAFNQFYEKNTEAKELQNKLQELKEMQAKMLDQVAFVQQREREAHRKELEELITAAKLDLDYDRVTELTIEKKRLEQERVPEQRVENPLIQKYRQDNPLVNPLSDQFNPAFNRVMEQQQQAEIVRLTGGDAKRVTPEIIMQSLETSMRATKAMFGMQQQTERPKAPASAPVKKPAAKGASANDLDAEGREMYEFLKAENPSAAESFLKSMVRG